MRIKNLLICLVAAITCGCKKVPPISCTYLITPYLESVEDEQVVIDNDIIAYAAYADTTLWEVSSYDNALSGVLSSRSGGGTMTSDLEREQSENGVVELGVITDKPIIIIVCRQGSRSYGWKQAYIAEGIDNVFLSITFRPWDGPSSYDEASWKMVNE